MTINQDIQTSMPAAHEAQPGLITCSVDQIHRGLSGAIRDERRVEATISGIRDRGGDIWITLSQTLAENRGRMLSGRIDRSAMPSLTAAADGPFGSAHLGWTITADIRLSLAGDGRIKATVLEVLQLVPSPMQRSAGIALQRLRDEGLVAQQRRLSPPSQIQSVAVIAPAGSAGKTDVAAILDRLFGDWRVEVRPIPVVVEGRGAEASISAGLAQAFRMAAAGEIDLVLLVRGGGEPAALAYLDNEALARQVATMSVPVITGIGHAENRTLIDEVAWHAAETPTDAAQHVIRLRAAQARPVSPVVHLRPTSQLAILDPVPESTLGHFSASPAATQDNRPEAVAPKAEQPLMALPARAHACAPEPVELPGYPRVWGTGSIPVQSADHARRLETLTIAFADGNVPMRVVE